MLKFKIEGQIISRLDDTKVVADSIDYLTASFEFPFEWKGTKTAVFRKGRATYSVVIVGDDCIVPWEVLEHSTSFTVSAFCGTRITSNTVHIPVIPSGYSEGDTPKPPTPDVYTQLVEEVDGVRDTANEADSNARGALELAESLSENISGISDKADEALGKSKEAYEFASDMHTEVIEANEKADEALVAISETKEIANNAVSIAESAVSKLSSVYKYEGSASWHLIRYGLIESGVGYPFGIGLVWNIEEADTIPSQYAHDGNPITLNAGDNIAIAWMDKGVPKFDKLSATVDLSNYATKDDVSELSTKTIILSNTMTKDEITSAINNANTGTRFDIRSNLDLYDVNITFPDESIVYSSTSNQKSIGFGYSDTSNDDVWNQSWFLSFGKFCKIYDISVNFSDNATASVGVNFGEGCEVANCYFSGYEPCSWSSNCTFVNCSFGYYIYSLSIGGSYIKCHFDYTNEWSEGVDCSAVSLIDCSSTQFKINPQNGTDLIAKIKALNPDMNIIDADGNEVKGLYATADDIGDIESALDSIIAIQNSLIGGDA